MTLADLILQYIPQIVTGAGIIAAVLPEPNPGSVGAALKKLINIAALNVGNATNQTPAQKKQRKAKTNIAVPLLLCSMVMGFAIAEKASAAAVLTWTAPSSHVNGSPLTPVAADVYTIYRDGATLGTVGGLTLTYSDSSAADCKSHVYAIDFTETAALLTSDKSTAVQPVDSVGCRPKAPALSVK